MKLIFFSGVLAFSVWTLVAIEAPKSTSAPSSESPRAKVTVENWDKGGALSHWVYTHVSEVFPSAVIRQRRRNSRSAGADSARRSVD